MTRATKPPSFAVTAIDARTIRKIVDRAEAMARQQEMPYDRQGAEMDIEAVHANGCPLDLERLLAADDFNFAHDVFGIHRHIDRETGKLTHFFLPRYARKEEVCRHSVGFGPDDECVACDTEQREREDADGPSRDVEPYIPPRPFLFTDKDDPGRYRP